DEVTSHSKAPQHLPDPSCHRQQSTSLSRHVKQPLRIVQRYYLARGNQPERCRMQKGREQISFPRRERHSNSNEASYKAKGTSHVASIILDKAESVETYKTEANPFLFRNALAKIRAGVNVNQVMRRGLGWLIGVVHGFHGL